MLNLRTDAFKKVVVFLFFIILSCVCLYSRADGLKISERDDRGSCVVLIINKLHNKPLGVPYGKKTGRLSQEDAEQYMYYMKNKETASRGFKKICTTKEAPNANFTLNG